MTSFEKEVTFDWELSPDDRQLYCLEMTEKAFRHAGLRLSEPVVLADMENINEFPSLRPRFHVAIQS